MKEIDTFRNFLIKEAGDELEGLLHPKKEAQLNLSREEKLKLAKDPNITPEQQEMIVRHENYFIRANLAENESITPEIQKLLAEDESEDVKYNLAINKHITPEVQEMLARDENRRARYNLAKNPSITPETQKILLEDTIWEVRYHLAGNKSLTLEIQILLAQDKYLYIREILAKNPTLHPEAQKILAQDKNWKIKQNLNQNPNLSHEVKMILVQKHLSKGKTISYSPEIRNIDKIRDYVKKDNVLDELEGLLPPEKEAQLSLSFKEKWKLAEDPNVTPEQQLELAQDDLWEIKSILAENSFITPETQKILAKDENPDVKQSLINNPNLSPEAQIILSLDENEIVKKCLARNPSLTGKLQRNLVRDAPYVKKYLSENPSLIPELQKLFMQQDDSFRHILASNPGLLPELQEILAQDKRWEVRANLAENSALIPELQKLLLQDKNKNVIEHLSFNPNLIPEVKDPLVKKYLEQGKQVSYNPEIRNIDKLRDYVKKDNVLDELEGLLPPEKEAKMSMTDKLARNFLIRESMLKSALGLQTGSIPYRAATNLVIEDFPFDDHPKISAIKTAIETAFSPQMVQKMIIGGKVQDLEINVQDIMKQHAAKTGTSLTDVDTPFYIRLKYTKSLLPQATADDIKNEIQNISPSMIELMKHLENNDLAPQPYYAKEENNNPEAMKILAKEMIDKSVSMNNQQMGAYWQNVLNSIENDGPYKSIVVKWKRSGWHASITQPISNINEIRHERDLLRAIQYAETPPSPKTNPHKFPRHTLDKEVLKTLIDGYYQDKQLPYSKQDPLITQDAANKTYEKIVKVFDTPPEQRDIDKILGKNPPKNNPYADLTQLDLRFVLQAMRLKTAKGSLPLDMLRYHAELRKWPNGIDVEPIFPPIKYEKNRYKIDYENGNLGLKELKRNSTVLSRFLTEHGELINKCYNELSQYAQNTPIMRSATSSGNLQLLLSEIKTQKIVNPSTLKFKGSDIFQNELNEISTQYGANIAGIIAKYLESKFKNKNVDEAGLDDNKEAYSQTKNEIKTYASMLAQLGNEQVVNFASQLLNTSPRGTTANAECLAEAAKLFEVVDKYGPAFAKVMDYLRYVIEEKTPDPVRGVRGRNYAAAGQSGEIIIGVQYAYNAKIEDVTHGDVKNKEALDSVINKQIVNINMLRKTKKAPMSAPEVTTLPQPPKSGWYNLPKYVKLIPKLRFIVTQKTGAMHRGTKYNVRELTPDDVARLEGQQHVYEEQYASPTLDGALKRLENLYPQASDMLANEFHMIRLRLEVAEQRILQAIQYAIEIRMAELSQDPQDQINPILVTDQHGTPVESQEFEQQVSSKEGEILETKPEYAAEVEEETTIEEAIKEDEQKHKPSEYLFSSEIGSVLISKGKGELVSEVDKLIQEGTIDITVIQNAYKYYFKKNHEGFVKWLEGWLEEIEKEKNTQHPFSTQYPQQQEGSLGQFLVNKGKADLLAKINKLIEQGIVDENAVESLYKEGNDEQFFIDWLESLAAAYEIEDMNEDPWSKNSSVINSLIKTANVYDKIGLTNIANKVDLILAKLGN